VGDTAPSWKKLQWFPETKIEPFFVCQTKPHPEQAKRCPLSQIHRSHCDVWWLDYRSVGMKEDACTSTQSYIKCLNQ